MNKEEWKKMHKIVTDILDCARRWENDYESMKKNGDKTPEDILWKILKEKDDVIDELETYARDLGRTITDNSD